MIFSTGLDIIEVYRIKQALARTPRFSDRVFTVAERKYCDDKRAAAAQSYAGRYAAKEAFFKALGTGWRGKLTWHDVEVVNDADGAPSFNISGEAKAMLRDRNIVRVHLSISHTTDTAAANVIFETD